MLTSSRITTRETFILVVFFQKRFIHNIFLIFLDTTNQHQLLKDFMNNIQHTIKFTFEHSTQELSATKIQIRADHKLSTTHYRKPKDCAAILQLHSNRSLKCKKSIIYLLALRYLTISSKPYFTPVILPSTYFLGDQNAERLFQLSLHTL